MQNFWDTDASLGLTPYKAEVFEYVRVNSLVKDVAAVGVVAVIYKHQNDKGEEILLQCILYHLPTADIHLFSW